MKYMAITVRLNDKEQEALRKKCVELNKALINKNLMPIKFGRNLRLLIAREHSFHGIDALYAA